MNYKDLFYILGGVFNFEIIMSFAAYDAIEMILNYKKKILKSYLIWSSIYNILLAWSIVSKNVWW